MKRPGVFVGLLVFAVMVYIVLNTLRTEGPGSRGVQEGTQLPPFAMPLAVSDLDGDANVSDKACSVRGEKILNVCELAERGPVVLAFFAEPSQRCDDEVDTLDRLRSQYPDVQFAAVAIRGNRTDLRAVIRDSGLRYPVGYDHDGQVANVYRVAGCPTTTFAYPGGIVMHTYLGLLDEARLSGVLKRLVAGSEQRGWKQPAA